jgi:Arc/MetJ-type ribon-helix-helix transcriptional regulator
MKERASFTFDKETIFLIDKILKSSKYRNKSHVVEEAIKLLKEKEFSPGKKEKPGEKEGKDE